MRIHLALLALAGRGAEKFVKYGSFSPTPLSLKKLTTFGETATQASSFNFLKHELPVRLANIMQEILLLPENLLRTPSVQLVISWYEQTFKDLIEFDEVTESNNSILAKYGAAMARISNRHAKVVETMAAGVMEMKERYGTDTSSDHQLQYFLDRFYMMRISIRMLINQHVLLFAPEQSAQRQFIGCIDPNCDVVQVFHDAYDSARFLCDHYYMASPELKLNIVNETSPGKIEIVYVPSHLYHIFFELIKNAMRAVMETHNHAEAGFPPIEVLICLGREDVCIKISDKGGGIPRSLMDFVFRYTYTTANPGARSADPSSHLTGGPVADGSQAPLAGYGYGLPLARLYAKYFNGDLQLISVEGLGSDALVYVKRRATDADELLPIFNQTSAKNYQQVGLPIGDWSNSQMAGGLHRPFRK